MRSSRHLWTGPVLAPLLLVVALVASGCGTQIDGIDDRGDGPAAGPTTLVVSDVWVKDQQADPGTGGAAGGSGAQARLASLQRAIDALRKETGTGWTGRQDDVTGYLTELRGGSWPGAASAFMDRYGPDLFGVDSSALQLGTPDTVTIPGIATTKATQVLSGVPVQDASLVLVERDAETAEPVSAAG